MRPVTIAVDAMGGELAPEAAVNAAAQISRETTIQLLLTGDETRIHALLRNFDHDPARIDIVPASRDVDDTHLDPMQRNDHRALAEACRLVAAGAADGLVSAGSTRALIANANKELHRIPGVKRAALAAVYPTHERSLNNDRFSLLLDVGATVHCDAEELLHFAYMGHAYASRISRVPYPSIGLLNVGGADTDGDEILARAHSLISEDPRLNFIGNMQGHDIPKGLADVVVCEGLLGDVILKMAEGMTEVFNRLGSWAYRHSLKWKAGFWLLSGVVRQLRNITDYREYGGAPILGFRHIVIKAHRRSHARTIANAVKVAAKAARDGVCEEIEAAVVDFHKAREKH